MKPRHAAMGAALVGAAALVLFGERAPQSDIVEPAERAAPRAPAASAPSTASSPSIATVSAPQPAALSRGGRVDQTAGAGGEGATDRRVPALVPRDVLIGDGDAAFGQARDGKGGGPFGSRDWTPVPPPPAPAPPPPPPPPPSAPPLPFTFIGKAVAAGGWEVYLTRGERTYVVRDKDTIDGAYRVDAIAPPVMTLTYLPLNQVQRLNIGVFE